MSMEQANFYVSISQIIHHCCTFSFIKNTLTFYCFVHFDTHATKFCHFLLAAAKSAGAKSFPIKGEAAWSNGYHLGLRRGRSAVQISLPPFQSFFGIQTFREVSPYRTSPTGGISESNDPNRRREE